MQPYEPLNVTPKSLEAEMVKRHYVRCPNSETRWYASGPGIMETKEGDLHIVYRPEHAPEGRIVIVPQFGPSPDYYGFHRDAIASFRDVFELDRWLAENGRVSR